MINRLKNIIIGKRQEDLSLALVRGLIDRIVIYIHLNRQNSKDGDRTIEEEIEIYIFHLGDSLGCDMTAMRYKR